MVSSKTRWVNEVPKKVNIHAWKVKLDCLPTRLNISRRGMSINSILCPNCDKEVESSSHIFFSCQFAREIFARITSWWEVPFSEISSYDEWFLWLMNLRLPLLNKQMLEGVCYTMWWNIWSFRNKNIFGLDPPKKEMIFDDIVTDKPYDSFSIIEMKKMNGGLSVTGKHEVFLEAANDGDGRERGLKRCVNRSMLRPFMKIDRHKRLSQLKRRHFLLTMLCLLMCTTKCQLYFRGYSPDDQLRVQNKHHINERVTCKGIYGLNTRVNNAEFGPIRAPNERKQQHNNVSYGSCHCINFESEDYKDVYQKL
ncbi:RNA-directed DNA polymerase, eukaryota [Tanacetum coccineum]